jgi:hypothetical protein
LDDGCVAGDAPVVAHYVELLREEGGRIGLTLRDSKCEVIGPLQPAFDLRALFPSFGSHGAVDDFCLLGTPCGSRPSQLLWAQEALALAKRKIGCLSALRHPQLAFALLRACGGFPLVGFVLRAVGYTATLEEYDRDVAVALDGLVGPLDEAGFVQAALPTSLGGLGLRRSAPYASAALAAAAIAGCRGGALFFAAPYTVLGLGVSDALAADPSFLRSPVHDAVLDAVHRVESPLESPPVPSTNI